MTKLTRQGFPLAITRQLLNLTLRSRAAVIEAGETVRLMIEMIPDGDLQVGEAVPVSHLQAVAVINAQTEKVSTRSSKTLALALKHGDRRAAEILGGSEMLSSDALADRLGVSWETVNRMRQRGELLGLEGVRRGVRYPNGSFQFRTNSRFPRWLSCCVSWANRGRSTAS